MADVDTSAAGDFEQSPDPRKDSKMLKDDVVKMRIEKDIKADWQSVARDHSQTLTEFITAAVEAAIIGKIDQAGVDAHLRAIRSKANAAAESSTIEEARVHIAAMKKLIAVARGTEKAPS